MKISAVNEESILINFGSTINQATHLKIKSVLASLDKLEGILNIVPSYTDIIVTYDLLIYDYKDLMDLIMKLDFNRGNQTQKTRLVKIPVCYDDIFGIDMNRVAEINSLTKEDVIEKHTATTYLIYMMGFVPGFPYLGGLDEELWTPRLDSPRIKIPKGSVGIGGKQTGIYPLESPGGWNIIGRTPVRLFDQEETLLKMGDLLQFISVDMMTFNEIENQVADGIYEVSYEWI